MSRSVTQAGQLVVPGQVASTGRMAAGGDGPLRRGGFGEE